MKRIRVAAAVIRRGEEVLIARRPADKHQGGLWEFPGGKVEPGEGVREALARELEEELGIVPEQARPLICISHDYPDKSVCLDVWEVTTFRGGPEGREGQPLRWVPAEALPSYAFPAANQPIVTAARLPSRYAISPDSLDREVLTAWAEERLSRGIRLLLLRAPSLPEQAYLRLAEALLPRCREAGARLLLHGDPVLLERLPTADGLHMPARFMKALARRPLPAGKWWAVSTHDASEMALAGQLGADFVTLSPVQPTASHPEASTLGWARFTELAAKATVPVYALGGLGEADIETAWQAGAQGIAAIRGL